MLAALALGAVTGCTELRSIDELGAETCDHDVAQAPRNNCPVRETPEDDMTACADGCDNDGDSFVDCQDDDCARFAATLCLDTMENTIGRCSDGIDNDGDGPFDCNDPNCFASPDPTIDEFCELAEENTVEECMDGLDNDANSFTDCADRGCTRDARASAAAIEHCMMVAELSENTAWPTGDVARCDDGTDNDGDGLVDCQDPECGHAPNCVGGGDIPPREYPLACDNGIDDDQDGVMDCEDPDCLYSRRLSVCSDAQSMAARCGSRECGNGPCGISCGTCPVGQRCTEEYLCVPL